MAVLAPGTPAPEFSLARADGERFTQEDLHGHGSILVFYPFAFSPVCTDQLQLYDPLLEELSGRGVYLYGVSCDATWSQSGLQGEARRLQRAALGLRAQGRGQRGLRRPSPRRLLPARARDHSTATGSCAGATRPTRPGELPGPDLLAQGVAAAFADGAAA